MHLRRKITEFSYVSGTVSVTGDSVMNQMNEPPPAERPRTSEVVRCAVCRGSGHS